MSQEVQSSSSSKLILLQQSKRSEKVHSIRQMRPKKKMEKRDTLRPNLITIDGCGAGAAEIIQEDSGGKSWT
jgi:hypothetical protein